MNPVAQPYIATPDIRRRAPLAHGTPCCWRCNSQDPWATRVRTHTNEASEQARYKSTALVGERISSGHECQVEEVVDMEHVWLGAFLKYSSQTAKAQTDGTGILSRQGGPLRCDRECPTLQAKHRYRSNHKARPSPV